MTDSDPDSTKADTLAKAASELVEALDTMMYRGTVLSPNAGLSLEALRAALAAHDQHGEPAGPIAITEHGWVGPCGHPPSPPSDGGLYALCHLPRDHGGRHQHIRINGPEPGPATPEGGELPDGIPEHLYVDIESAIHIHMGHDGQSDEANDWVTDLMSAISPFIERELARLGRELAEARDTRGREVIATGALDDAVHETDGNGDPYVVLHIATKEAEFERLLGYDVVVRKLSWKEDADDLLRATAEGDSK